MELSKLEKELLKDDELYDLIALLNNLNIPLKTLKRAVSVFDNGLCIEDYSAKVNENFSKKQKELITLCKKKGGSIKKFAINVERQGKVSIKQEKVMRDAITPKYYEGDASSFTVYREPTKEDLKREEEDALADRLMLEAMGHDCDPHAFAVNKG